MQFSKKEFFNFFFARFFFSVTLLRIYLFLFFSASPNHFSYGPSNIQGSLTTQLISFWPRHMTLIYLCKQNPTWCPNFTKYFDAFMKKMWNLELTWSNSLFALRGFYSRHTYKLCNCCQFNHEQGNQWCINGISSEKFLLITVDSWMTRNLR